MESKTGSLTISLSKSSFGESCDSLSGLEACGDDDGDDSDDATNITANLGMQKKEEKKEEERNVF